MTKKNRADRGVEADDRDRSLPAFAAHSATAIRSRQAGEEEAAPATSEGLSTASARVRPQARDGGHLPIVTIGLR
jgi:hypothetical protein